MPDKSRHLPNLARICMALLSLRTRTRSIYAAIRKIMSIILAARGFPMKQMSIIIDVEY